MKNILLSNEHTDTGMHAPQDLQTLQPMQNMQSQENQEVTEQLTPLSEWHDNYEVMEMFHISARTLQTLRAPMASCRLPRWAEDATTRRVTCSDSWKNRTETAA